MTTTQSLTNHHLTVDLDEDNMEMATSPYREPQDDDIDFELDDQREHSIEDNSMIDDTTENLDTNLNQDDMMLYDDDDNDLVDFDEDLPMDPNESPYMQNHDIHGGEEAPLVELETDDQTIQDASFEDANLIADEVRSMNGEGVENDLQEEATNVEITITEDDTTIVPTEENEVDTRTETNDKYPNVAAEEDNLAETQTTDVKDFAVEASSEEAPRNEPEHSSNEDYPSHIEPSVEATESPQVNVQSEQSTKALAAGLDEPTQGQNDEPDAKVEAVTSNETQKSPQRETTPVNLHPVAVRYNGEDCWLFPPFENAETKHVFLDDPTLASEPFDRLIAALRSNLINNQEMADHDEIVFDIPVLGLHICEDSKHASLLNLSRVIDIYMMLSQNEGLTVFEPLYCELSTRVCLADQFAYVEDAAFVRRITYADFAAEQADSREEVPQTEDPTVHEDDEEEEEEIRADVSTYYDAADDHNGEGESLTTTVEARETGARTDDATKGDDTQYSRSKAEAETFDDENAGKEDPSLHPDNVDDLADSQPKTDSDEATLIAKVEDAAQKEQDQSNEKDEELVRDREDEVTAKQSNDTSAHIEPEADEDLFADDPVEPEVPETESGKTSQAPEANSNAADQATHDNINENDDFDFENWSDDEQDVTKTDEVSNLLSTPSQSVNSKRKFIDENDDFLDIDVSTPEPKRSRQS